MSIYIFNPEIFKKKNMSKHIKPRSGFTCSGLRGEKPNWHMLKNSHHNENVF